MFNVTNFGPSRKLPVRGLGYNIAKGQTIPIQDEETARILGEYPMVDVEEVDDNVTSEVVQDEPEADANNVQLEEETVAEDCDKDEKENDQVEEVKSKPSRKSKKKSKRRKGN